MNRYLVFSITDVLALVARDYLTAEAVEGIGHELSDIFGTISTNHCFKLQTATFAELSDNNSPFERSQCSVTVKSTIHETSTVFGPVLTSKCLSVIWETFKNSPLYQSPSGSVKVPTFQNSSYEKLPLYFESNIGTKI